MSSKYKVDEDAIAHFVTFSVVGWIDVFSREQYKELFVESFVSQRGFRNVIFFFKTQFLRNPDAEIL